MTKKIRKIGVGSQKNHIYRKIIDRKLKPKRDQHPTVEFRINIEYQGVKKIKELAELERVTISRKTLEKLSMKKGHLSVNEIRDVLKDPDGIYYKQNGKEEVWFFVNEMSNTKKVVVVIERMNKKHRISTAHILKNKFLSKRLSDWN